jgi:hypothetical protein
MGAWTAAIAHTIKATLGYDFDKRIISAVIIGLLDMKSRRLIPVPRCGLPSADRCRATAQNKLS